MADLLHDPIYCPGPSPQGYTYFGDVARGLGLTFNSFGLFRHARFGPRHVWRKGRPVVLDADLDKWMNQDWRRGEREMLGEFQHIDKHELQEK